VLKRACLRGTANIQKIFKKTRHQTGHCFNQWMLSEWVVFSELIGTDLEVNYRKKQDLHLEKKLFWPLSQNSSFSLPDFKNKDCESCPGAAGGLIIHAKLSETSLAPSWFNFATLDLVIKMCSPISRMLNIILYGGKCLWSLPFNLTPSQTRWY
jgi:hypothetical protein